MSSAIESSGNFSLSAGRVHHVPNSAHISLDEVRRGIRRLEQDIAGMKAELRAKRRALRWMEKHPGVRRAG